MIRESFNDGWYVRKDGRAGDPIGPVTVPYDAMLVEARDPNTRNGHNTGYFPGGVYRYSKSFMAPEEWRDRSVCVEFEGVYLRSEVFVNGHLAGGRPSGYAIFRVDLDGHLAYGAENVVEVVANNDGEPNSRWYSGSGIYRPVHLLVGGRVRVTPDGLRVATVSVDGPDAVVEVETEIVNDSSDRRSVQISTLLTGPHGAAAGSAGEEVVVAPQATTTVRQRLTVPAAALWSPDHPDLHVAEVTVSGDGDVVDEARAEFGIRTLAVDARRGLRINGEEVKLRGACIHHDNGVIGANTLDAAEDRRIRLLKESGYNAIRSSHNPAARSTLRACDRHGVLVMDELTDVWFSPKGKFDYSLEFEEWWERDLEALLAKNINHPSVVMHSIGNEIAETASPKGIELNRRMAARARELDPTRFVTNAINGFLNGISPTTDEKWAKRAAKARASEDPGKNIIAILNFTMGLLEKALPYVVRLGVVDKRTRDSYAALDIAGYNYMTGRYAGDAARYPDRVIVGSETNPSDTVAIWQEIEHLPNVIGDFTWTGWDYVGEAGISVIYYGERRKLFAPWPGLLAGEPVIDITGHRQTQSYLNEIAWHLRAGPHLAVQPVNHAGEKQAKNGWRSSNSIASWSWEGCEGRIATVEVYADAARVQLLLDGRPVGSAEAGPAVGYLATFSVPYRPGELTAVAYDAAGNELGRDTLRSAGPSLRLNVEPECDVLRADGADLAYLNVTLTDDDGIVRPLADRSVTIEVSGAGRLLGFGSAQPITEEGFAANAHRTYWGRALAVVRAGHDAGEIRVTATAPGCELVTIVIPVESP